LARVKIIKGTFLGKYGQLTPIYIYFRVF
jgi:hypothetical protein